MLQTFSGVAGTKKEGKYGAEFTQNINSSATFARALEETEIDIPVNELPATIVSYIQSHGAGRARGRVTIVCNLK